MRARSSLGHSFLDGQEWVLRTRVLHERAGVQLTHDAAIHATPETREKWTAQYWSLYPSEPVAFARVVEKGEVKLSVMFRFRPTARMKKHYGEHPVLAVARAAEGNGSLQRVSPGMLEAIEQYGRDKRMLEQQRRQAWLELRNLRLPVPPLGYRWQLVGGDPRAYSDVLQFQLKRR